MNLDFIDIGGWFESLVDWCESNLSVLFDTITTSVNWLLDAVEAILEFPHFAVMTVLFAAIAYFSTRKWGLVVFTCIGFALIRHMELWSPTMKTLALVLVSVLIALLIGLPIGVWAAKSDAAENLVRPVLDFMQTLPAFVYLIPAVVFFSLGRVPAVIATLIFALPPCVRLTNLGIRQVPTEIREAAISFGSTPRQLLFKAELPSALPTIMAGINQTIMLSLSMVVIASMIGGGGLGDPVRKGIAQLLIDVGFEAGLAIVILAIFLDRVTQSLAQAPEK